MTLLCEFLVLILPGIFTDAFQLENPSERTYF